MAHKSPEETKKEIAEVEKRVQIGQQYSHYKHPEQHYQIESIGVLESTDEVCIGFELYTEIIFCFLDQQCLF